MENVYIGVDVGGMSIKAGLVNEQGKILHKGSIKTNSVNGGKEALLKDIKALMVEMVDYAKDNDMKPLAIGFGIPGVVNNKLGTIDYACNLYVEDVPLKFYLKDLNLPIFLSNDANVAALGEERFGAAKGYTDVVLLTLGTGIGGGVVIDDKLFEGVDGKGAELGHTVIVVDGHECACGRRGCFEAYASASALLKLTKEEMKKNPNSIMWDYCDHDIEAVTGLTSFECSKKGDEAAIKVIDTYVKYLSEGILNFCNIFRPQIILIGGGISNQGDYLLDKVKAYCEKYHYGYRHTPKVEIKIASLKNDAGIIGCACLAMDNLK